MMKKIRSKYYNKRIKTLDKGNVPFHDQKERKLGITIDANSGVDALRHDKIIKSPFNKNNVATMKSKQNSNKDIITSAC